MNVRVLVALAVLALLPATAQPQALTSLSSLRVRYNSQKATVQPTGALKTEIDAIDAQLAEAGRLGQTGEVRRLLAKGTTLLAGRPWTAEADFAGSLVLRTDRVVVDSSRPYLVRLEQIYQPAIELGQSLTARATLRRPPAGAGAAARQAVVVKDFGAVDGVSRDLRESPHFFELDLAGVPDGTYQLAVEVMDAGKAIGTSTLTISARQGLDALVARLEQGAANAPEAVRADILYPIDRMRQVNRGRLELRTFDPDADFASAEAVLAASRSGGNPFVGRTGDIKRAYLLESAGEIMPYRMYVPTTYNAQRAFPLIIALHGLGGTESSFFEGYGGTFPKLAEEHGYLVAAPLGYRVDGSYGWGLGNPPADPTTRTVQERSEEDVMQVLARVRQQYNVDPNRIYLTGHSMGAIGTWKIAPKYPDLWAAIGMFAGSGNPATLERIAHIPEYVVHGDADPTVNVRGSRTMVARMRELGITMQYTEVPGGTHSDVVAPGFPGLFEFFDKYQKAPPR
jgi:poly(3-hydroxybutyrate) depolymerase